MNAHLASLINAISLVALGAWGYFGSATPSATALIPVGVGVLLLACAPGVKKENKAVAHIAVLLTLLILFGLIKPLTGAIGRADSAAILRVGVMLATTVLAMVAFVQSFIAARKSRQAG
ncbi:MAG: hypothetical protein AAFV29_08285 [Myxococcota bacterium]